MIHCLRKFVLITIVLFGLLFIITPFATGTALDDYVAAPDTNYSYSLINTVNEIGYTGYILDMTSQKWRTSVEVDRPLWQHWLTIVVPDIVNHNTCMLIIGGGDNNPAPPDSVDWSLVSTAITAQTVVAYLEMIPNQPLYFHDETRSRSEDAIIAYSWDKYLTTGDGTWPVQLPMAKSVVRAMDTVEAFCASPGGGQITINDFMVGGTSKRGWTTWLTAAVDSRVSAIVPIVFDALNMERSFNHHHAAYGYWSSAVCDYEDMGIFEWIGTPEIRSLMDIVDPYAYRDRYTIPKYIINSTGDEFFLPDSSQLYFDDLPGEKYMRYVPNTGHSMGMEIYDVVLSLVSFYQAILNNSPLPRFSWTLETDGSIRVETLDTPDQVNLWQATNPTDRDFRYSTIGSAWTSSILTDQGGGVYIGQVPEPETGWTAFFVELTYNNGLLPYIFTTVVNVIPDFLPFDINSIAVDFGTAYGLYSYDQTNDWTQLNTANPGEMVAADIDENGQDELAVVFEGYGLYIYDGINGWTRINTVIPDGMITFNDTMLACDFGATYGLHTYNQANGWTQLNTANPGLIVSVDIDEDGKDELAVNFAGHGLYTYDDTNGWTRINTVMPEGMIAFDGVKLACDFGSAYGLHTYDETNGWTRLNTANPGEMVSVDIDEDGQDELAVGFAGYGLYTYDETNGWTRINTVIPEGMIAFDGVKLACDFGSAYGLHTYDETNGWTRLNTADPGEMVSVDINSDGQDELTVSFEGYGLYIYDDTNGWARINTVVPEGIKAIDLFN